MRAVFFATVLLAGFSGCTAGRQNASGGPEETVQAFYAALAEGQFETAYGLCDTLLMQDYLRSYVSEWEKMALKADTCACAIACSMMADMEVSVISAERTENKTEVRFRLEKKGHSPKGKKAVLRKEEGEWKIETVTEDK